MNTEILNKIYNYWFKTDNRKWFNATVEDDLFIKENFKKFLVSKIPLFDDVRELLAYIILYDQFPRHIYREEIKHELETKKTFIAKFDKIAEKLTKFAIDNKLFRYMNPEERVFALLPYRHTFEEDKIKLCLDLVSTWRDEEDTSIYKRFYKATLISLGKQINKRILRTRYNEYTSINDIKDVLDYYEGDIYLPTHLEKTSELVKNKIYKTVKQFIKNRPAILSLSGGVDSMILSFILKHLGVDFITVCMNYTNRETSYIETEFVKRWCYHMKIPLYVRDIVEINRTKKDRQIYEEATRIIRFDFYKRFNRPVILGHNADDVLENIFSNIKKQQKYENLDGMIYKSFEKDVEIWRPILKIYKKDIFEFAHKFNIPYLYDSTPKECERGRLRDILIPQVEEFEPRILTGLEELSLRMKEMYEIFNKTVLKQTFKEITVRPLFCEFSIKNKRDFGIVFWKPVITYIVKKLNIPHPSNKSFINFISRIKKRGNFKINMSKYVDIIVKNDNIYIIKNIQ